eukprot:Phypoly_transcript_01815.p1 GENE.Phypoly_transcript_01815~~Phypoly_transcript_01815.p1  ORF type:complete len:964 (+),score=177.55 Phypoly_transcript_01815:205-3096(+)
MFRKVYAQIGISEDLQDEQEADTLTKETTPPTTPVAEPAPSFSLTQFISLNLNKLGSKSQPSPSSTPRSQAPIQRQPSVTSPAVPVPSPSATPPTSSANPQSTTPPHQSLPSSSTGVPLSRASSLSSSSQLKTASPNNSPSSTLPRNLSTSTLPRNLSNSQLSEPQFAVQMRTSTSNTNLQELTRQPSIPTLTGPSISPKVQMRPSGSSSNLTDVARQSPIPLIPSPPSSQLRTSGSNLNLPDLTRQSSSPQIPAPPLSNSPIFPAARSDSPQERPIPPTAAPTTFFDQSADSSFFTSAPPTVTINPPLSSVKRVSSVPQIAPVPNSLPPHATARRNSNTPSPLSQPWPSPEKSSQPPSLPTSPNNLLVDIDDEEESLINRSTHNPLPTMHPRPTSLPPNSITFPSPQPPQSTHPSRPSSQPPLSATPPLSTSLPLYPIPENPISSSPQSSPQEHPKPNQEFVPPATVPSSNGIPIKERPSLRDSFQSDHSLGNSGGSTTSEPPEDILRSGWLTKQEPEKENWVRHFFTLTPTSMYYYEGVNENLKGKISLEGYEVIIVDPEEVDKQLKKKKKKKKKKIFYMHCETRDDMLAWIIAVQEVLDKLNPNGSMPVKEKLVPIPDTDPKYELVYAMLHAIRFSVSKMAALPYLDIGLEELNASTSFSTDKQGSAAIPSSNYPYSFIDYAPKAFRKIREIFGFNCADYLLSLTSQYTLSELPTPGKSGSFFYYSNDRKFMLKTISATEFDNLRQMMPNYFLHILQNPNTLLTRLFGLHKISTENSRSIIFVVMENIFLDYEMEETYDLKGSTIGRKSDGTSSILKDLDWKRRILLDSERRNSLLFQIELDCKFLEKNNIMDYSFLIGLRFINSKEEERNKRPYSSIFQREKGGYQATTEDGGFYDIVYYFGIIDIFTTYNIKKQLEHTYKSAVYETKDAISVVDAVKYAHRFRKFISSICGWQPQKSN